MGINLEAGDNIPLRMLLEDRATDKFIRARVRDDVGAEISGSPFSVAHLSDGFYADSTSATMPDKPHITVEYDVFDDALFTTSSIHEPDGERFDIDELASLVDQIENIRGVDIVGTILEDQVIMGSVKEEKIIGTIIEDDLDGTVSEKGITGEVTKQIITGTVEC